MLRYTKTLKSEDCDVFVESPDLISLESQLVFTLTAIDKNSVEHLIYPQSQVIEVGASTTSLLEGLRHPIPIHVVRTQIAANSVSLKAEVIIRSIFMPLPVLPLSAFLKIYLAKVKQWPRKYSINWRH
jgi:hypothetical protein